MLFRETALFGLDDEGMAMDGAAGAKRNRTDYNILDSMGNVTKDWTEFYFQNTLSMRGQLGLASD